MAPGRGERGAPAGGTPFRPLGRVGFAGQSNDCILKPPALETFAPGL